MAGTKPMNSYFVPGYGISRTVIQNEIRYHCGPDAIVRPYTHQGRDGFLVTTSGPPLTKEQIADLRESSRDFEEKQAATSGFVNQPVQVGNRGRRSVS
ncbi:hypothetical protein BDY21DRAFT_341358 [Lineolata rhizophorae]|uniref:Uncharacterized protein n=1 Tax=Lineolata rhizophorae TaxID=578093 RepID=A0A6A6P462_9PEZI|nr:hypothetical protein BDY21DRAFT_341358 [Lineolata rhizophorae]